MTDDLGVRSEVRIDVQPFSPRFTKDVSELILGIQRGEFAVDVTLEDQPDLLEIPSFYQAAGGFWLALDGPPEAPRLAGTIALIDFGAGRAALRKMFVRSDRRGPAWGIARRLLDTAVSWCGENEIGEIYLGTLSILHAAHRFYEKNGFVSIDRDALPSDFPLMPIDTNFYRRQLELAE